MSDIVKKSNQGEHNMESGTSKGSNKGGFFDSGPPSVSPQIQSLKTKPARGIFVYGVPPNTHKREVAGFFNQALESIGGKMIGEGDPVINVIKNDGQTYAIVEMRSVVEASNAMALNNVIFQGGALRIERPREYNALNAQGLGPSQPSPNLNLAAVGLGPGSTLLKIEGFCILKDYNVRRFLELYEPVKRLEIGRDWNTGKFLGFVFCVFQDESKTEEAIQVFSKVSEKEGMAPLKVSRVV